MKVSIIIPTYNEAKNIEKLIRFLITNGNSSIADIIVVDGGSQDNTIEVAKFAGAFAVLSPTMGRAAQMNHGARISKGEVLYFIHADCFPPKTFIKDVEQAIEKGYDFGRYRTRFDSEKTILKINAWFTRFDLFVCMGGDQTLFIKKWLFEECKGFKEEMKIMEEYEFCDRAKKIGKYKILKGEALISARKYDGNSWIDVQKANYKVVSMYKKGASQQDILETYKHMLTYRKNGFDS
jgi:rSAM/selenodomain-associated transferase 2